MKIIGITVLFYRTDFIWEQDSRVDDIEHSFSPKCAEIKLEQDLFVSKTRYKGMKLNSDYPQTYDWDDNIAYEFNNLTKYTWYTNPANVKRTITIRCRSNIVGCKCSEAQWCQNILENINDGGIYSVILG